MMRENQKGTKNYSLKRRFRIFFILFIVAVYSVVVITAIQQVLTVTETLGIQLGLPIVDEAIKVIDGDAFEALSKSLNPQDPYYETVRRELLAIKEKSKALYLYTMAPVEGNVFRFIIDGGDPNRDEGFSPLGTEEDISGYSKPILKAMQTKTYQVSALDYSEWGWLISVYRPILNSSGEAVGFAACDFVPSDIFTRLWSQIIWELVIAGIFALLGIAAYLYLVHGINRQNRRLVELKEAAEASSAALKEERDKVVVMKDRLMAEMRAFMEMLQVKPDDFAEFTEEAESRLGYVNTILDGAEISTGALQEIHQNVQAVAEKAENLKLQTFSGELGELAAKIEKLWKAQGFSAPDKAEIAVAIAKIMKALNDSRQVVKKIDAFRSGNAQLRNQGS
jgi:methyl-accepting chemotaxis protein